MCGIAGMIALVPGTTVDQNPLEAMGNSIVHRGPDGHGIFVSPDRQVGFAHRRLSIIDLVGGSQPMTDSSGRLTIVYNGEIYNFPELKKNLLSRGYHFLTASDTEAILCLFHAYGKESFNLLNGIFAFALFDGHSGETFLVRDHLGVKPLYYTVMGRQLIFGSEIKAIFASGKCTPEVDHQALDTFLSLRYNPSPETLFRGIRKLPPASYLRVAKEGKWSVHRYWDYSPETDSTVREDDAVEHYQQLLEAAVRRQMLSDVPVGLLLSGGIDSAVIGMLMKHATGERINTFSIGFPGVGDFNELDDARATARLMGSDHHEITLSGVDYLDFFLHSFRHSEEPIAEPTIPALYHVSKLAAEHVKVVLAGQGADEPLAGYRRYFGEKYLAQYGGLTRALPLEAISRLLPRNERFRRAAYASRFTLESDRFKAGYTIVTPEQKMGLYSDAMKASIGPPVWDAFDDLYGRTGGLTDSLSRLLFIDTRMYLSDDLLIFGDKMSMAHSLEMRVPFLDLNLIKFLETLPGSLKLRRMTHKYIHKKALRKWLPKDVIHRKKRGFATPVDSWLRSDLGKMTGRLVKEASSASRLFFNVSMIDDLINRHRSGQENFQRQLFALLSFELWHRSWIQGESFRTEG